jgi:hypothetical protein
MYLWRKREVAMSHGPPQIYRLGILTRFNLRICGEKRENA